MKVQALDAAYRRRAVSGWIVAPCLFVVALIISLAQFLAATQADPNEPGSPSWRLLLFIVCAGIAGLAVLIWPDARRWFLAAPYGFAIVAVTLLTSWSTANGLYLSSPSYLQHAPGPMATAGALQALRSTTCVTVHDSPIQLLPTPYERCAAAGEVDYLYPTNPNWNLPSSVGLIFRPDGAQPETPDVCVRRLSHNWWAEMGSYGAGRPCAPLFQFVGGG